MSEMLNPITLILPFALSYKFQLVIKIHKILTEILIKITLGLQTELSRINILSLLHHCNMKIGHNYMHTHVVIVKAVKLEVPIELQSFSWICFMMLCIFVVIVLINSIRNFCNHVSLQKYNGLNKVYMYPANLLKPSQ